MNPFRGTWDSVSAACCSLTRCRYSRPTLSPGLSARSALPSLWRSPSHNGASTALHSSLWPCRHRLIPKYGRYLRPIVLCSFIWLTQTRATHSTRSVRENDVMGNCVRRFVCLRFAGGLTLALAALVIAALPLRGSTPSFNVLDVLALRIRPDDTITSVDSEVGDPSARPLWTRAITRTPECLVTSRKSTYPAKSRAKPA